MLFRSERHLEKAWREREGRERHLETAWREREKERERKKERKKKKKDFNRVSTGSRHKITWGKCLEK